MQDFKNISQKKRFRFFRSKTTPTLNAFRKQHQEGKVRDRRLRFILPVVAVVLGIFPIVGLLLPDKAAVSSLKPVSRTGVLDSYQTFKLAIDSLGSSRIEGGALCAPLTDGGSVVYSINDEVQKRVKRVMEQQQVPYAVFVAIEPKTGRILALAGHSAVDPGWEKRCFFNIFPMASLFKIITAAAALEEKKVSPHTVVAFRGRLTSENPKYWSSAPTRGSRQMDLAVAMGKSVNPVFGKLASDVVGRDSLMTYVDRFGFNQSLMPGTPMPPSVAHPPQSDNDLQLMGAGLAHEVKISPLHAAMMIAAIANDGVMLVPTLVKEIRNGKGQVISSAEGQVLRRLVTPETASGLSAMLSTTVHSGTSRKAFHDRRGRPLLASVDIAAKTGSINGNDPDGHYSWFTAYAPIEDPQIAVAAMVINNPKWKIKASYLGEQGLEAFFR